MTKFTKQIIGFAVVLAVILLAVCALAWATSGFKNWDAKTWFDNWGKGTEQTEISEPSNKAKGAANAALNHDSEDGTANITLTGYAKPIVEKFISYGAYGGALSAKIVIDSDSGVALPGNPTSATEGQVITVKVYTCNADELTLAHTTIEKLFFHNATGADATGVYTYLRLDSFNSYYTNNLYYIIGLQSPGDTKYAASEEMRYVFVNSSGRNCSDAYCINSNIVLPKVFTDGTMSIRCYDSADMEAAENIDTFYSSNDVGDKNEFDVDFDNNNVNIALSEFGYLSEHLGQFSVEYYCNSLPSVSVGTVCYAGVPVGEIPHTTFEVKKLSTPTNIRYEDGKLLWDAVTGARGYTVFWNDSDSGILTSNELDLVANGFSAGEYMFRVRALGNIDEAFVNNGLTVTAFNAGSTIMRVVTLNYNIDGETVSKFVPYGAEMTDYLYDVEVKGRTFGGWFYDKGFSRQVKATDKIDKDTDIYARVSDLPVNTKTWWDKNMWFVIAPLIALAVATVAVGIVFAVKRRRAV